MSPKIGCFGAPYSDGAKWLCKNKVTHMILAQHFLNFYSCIECANRHMQDFPNDELITMKQARARGIEA